MSRFGATSTDNVGAGAGGKKKRGGGGGVCMANLLFEEDESTKQAAKAKAAKKKPATEGKGFKTVEKKVMGQTVEAKEKKKQAKEAAIREEAIASFQSEQQYEEAQATKQVQKVVTKKYGKGPIGSATIDPEVAKAELKAAKALAKHQAMMQRGKAKSGGAVTEVKERVVTVDFEAEAEAARKAEEKEALKVRAVGGKKGGWGAAITPASSAAAAKHQDPAALPAGLQLSAAAPKQKGGQTKKQQQALQQLAQSKKNDSLFQERAMDEPTGMTVPRPPQAKTASIAKSDHASVVDHARGEHGSVVAVVRFCFVVASGRVVPLPTGAAARNDNAKKDVLAIATDIQRNGTAKGGFFITAEGKHFSDATTVDEPWMCESYIKALSQVLRQQGAVGKPVSAFPFWKKASGMQHEEQESEVKLALVAPTALALEHVAGVRAPLRKTVVAFRPFVAAVVEAGQALEWALGLIAEKLADTPEKLAWMPKNLATSLPALAELAASAAE
jgi:hypothetical protein